ncbi:Helix-turn-helix domain-containing protein [Streptoalloteichus tenebrarius]|uniref:Helix-turn-helix domain-containing protein n=1 Tax=Streptoalloteichus tenebrarius (strain ATCC 17920 / DSM 40477 / JCM 4838 / CBS 697.72 / NBRC 16177 / NCIMB 11028 / NRRL B-12390 / A12253. 1 / ISP 5477) TaxID=1933 RepID=A0ABT1HRN3_STRSD|nr:helix-turn-helix domain-containing protein [Streptoalloteichus tenebrarius]MCP2258178.1 Helix-turn-helix domain-containing protein [Streptoalloteichus tenebrarius]BFF04596.1 helix-turn-helix domain-containing protein [Streptoalloteichus tenebrarius]
MTEEPDQRVERTLDARSLRGLAHPLRVRILELLRADGPATASGLAVRLGESSGTTSWHLRQLAEHGFIEEDRERGTRRERWWRAAQETLRIRTPDLRAVPEAEGALDIVLRSVLDLSTSRVADFLSRRADLGEEWDAASSLSDWALHLTPGELRALNDEIQAVVERYRRERRAGDRPVVVQLQAFPRPSREDGE